MSDISTDAMMREAAMMDASDNHVWARKTRRLCIERDKLAALLAEVEADRRALRLSLDVLDQMFDTVAPAAQPAPEVAALQARLAEVEAERDAAQLGNHAVNEHEPTWAKLVDAWKARAEAAEARVKELESANRGLRSGNDMLLQTIMEGRRDE
jgi:hypothetical protein